jgi:hypothetical protein
LKRLQVALGRSSPSFKSIPDGAVRHHLSAKVHQFTHQFPFDIDFIAHVPLAGLAVFQLLNVRLP